MARTEFAVADVPKEVVLPEEVMTPERFALVVTVPALPVMLILIAEEVAIDAKVLAPVA